jgi:hypothetical protein
MRLPAQPENGIKKAKELLTTFSGIPTNIGGIFLTADAPLASPQPPELRGE